MYNSRNMLSKLTGILLAAALILFFPNVLEVNAATDNSCEIVILIDTSASMNWADPPDKDGARVTTEAVKSFAFLRPSFADTYISLVVYNQFVKTVSERTNVRTEWGITEYINSVDKINDDKVEDFSCWNRTTDIGAALTEAYGILDKSNAAKKAVLLFTDGQINLGEGVDISQSKAMSDDSRDKFASAGIPVYTIGLNADGTVDKEYLDDLSGKTGGKSEIALSAGGMIEYFLGIYAHLFDTVTPDIASEPIPNNGRLSYKFNVYGQAVKEENITFISESGKSTIKITGVITDTGVDIINDASRCVMDSSNMVSNIKLIEPMDGEWTIELIGNPGDVVKISEISLFDISLHTTIPDNKINLEYGDSFDFSVFLYNNDKDIQILTTQIYKDAESRTYVELTDSRGVSVVYPGKLNDLQNGFDFNLTFPSAGEYKIKVFLSNDNIYAVSGEITVNVTEPLLVIRSSGAEFLREEGANFQITAENGGEGKDLSELWSGMQGEVTLRLEGSDSTETFAFDINDNSTLERLYIPEKAGRYTVTAVLQGGGRKIESESIRIEFRNPQITSVFPDVISHTIKNGGNSVTYDLNEYFEIEGKGALKFKLENLEKSGGIEANVTENLLTVDFIGKGKNSFNIVAFDGHGAEYTVTVNVSVKSFADVIIIIAICAGVAVILAAAAAVIIRMNMKIGRRRFNLSVSKRENDDEIFNESVNIPLLKPLRDYKNKASVNLWRIIIDKKFFSRNVPDDFSQFCSRMTLQAVPFSNNFKIICKIKGQKTKLFAGRTVTFTFPDPGSNAVYTITFAAPDIQ